MSGIRFTDGTTTVTLQDGATGIQQQVQWIPATSSTDDVVWAPADRHGGEQVSYRRNVTESGTWTVLNSASNILTLHAQLNRLFTQAQERQRTGRGPRVYVEARSLDTGSWWRSEVLTGQSQPQDDKPFRGLNAGRQTLIVAWTRRWYWEGSETTLTLTNRNGTGTTLAIANTHDSSKDHFVAIDASGVTGELPTPAILRIQNTTNLSERTASVMIGHAARINPSPDYLIVEGETMAASGATTTQTGSVFSNGSMIVWDRTGTGEQILGHWILSSAQLAALQSGWYRFVWGGITNGNVSLRLEVQIEGLTTVGATPWVRMPSNTDLLDLASLALPPYVYGNSNNLYPLYLRLYARGEDAYNWTVGVDAIHMIPTESWRVLQGRGFASAYQVTILDDPIDGLAVSDWSGQRLGNYLTHGEPVMLIPGIAQRVFFLHSTDYNNYHANRTSTIQIRYRPRRLSF